MSVDDRIRSGLQRNASAAPPSTERALQATLERAQRRHRLRTVLTVAATVAVVALGLGLARSLLAAPVPPADDDVSVIGSWSAQVPPGDPDVDTARLAGTWTLTFVQDGTLIATPPGAYPGLLAGDTYSVQRGPGTPVLTTDLLAADTCAGAGPGRYGVLEDGDGLRFVAVSDDCDARLRLLGSSTWRASLPGASCVNNGGGACLGDLAPGTYRTEQSRTPFRYTVAAGWSNTQDLPGNFLLQPIGGDERFLGVFANVTVPDGCEEAPAPGVGTSVEAVAAWLSGHPGLDTTPAVPVTVGGLPGLRVDVSLSPDWRGTCSFSAGRPAVPILLGAGPAVLQHTLLPGFSERLYLLQAPDGSNVVVEVGPEGRSLAEFLRTAEPVVDSLVFTGGPDPSP